jgi:hypothetical protein
VVLVVPALQWCRAVRRDWTGSLRSTEPKCLVIMLGIWDFSGGHWDHSTYVIRLGDMVGGIGAGLPGSTPDCHYELLDLGDII